VHVTSVEQKVTWGHLQTHTPQQINRQGIISAKRMLALDTASRVLGVRHGGRYLAGALSATYCH